jgi:hypothetical protein
MCYIANECEYVRCVRHNAEEIFLTHSDLTVVCSVLVRLLKNRSMHLKKELIHAIERKGEGDI